MLRIAFDAKRAFNNFSGLGNYSRFIIQSLKRYYPENEYLCFAPDIKHTEFKKILKKEEVILPSSFLSSLFPSLWRSGWMFNDVEKTGAQIFHGLSNELPSISSKVRKVVTIHDLIFLRYPELYPSIDRAIYNKKFRKACQVADVVLAISEQTKSDIIDFYKVPLDKVKVIYQDCNPVYHQTLESTTLNKIKAIYRLPDNYLLCVGTLEKRKNQLSLLKAFAAANIKDLQLVLVGKVTAYKKMLDDFIVKNSLQNRISFLSNIPVEDMPGIFQSSMAVVYPSVFEGFGLPVLEGINSGVPVITSSGSCFAEAGGNGAMYVNPGDVDGLVNAIQVVVEDTSAREKMITSGKEHALQFRPERTMPELMKLYHSIL